MHGVRMVTIIGLILLLMTTTGAAATSATPMANLVAAVKVHMERLQAITRRRAGTSVSREIRFAPAARRGVAIGPIVILITTTNAGTGSATSTGNSGATAAVMEMEIVTETGTGTARLEDRTSKPAATSVFVATGLRLNATPATAIGAGVRSTISTTAMAKSSTTAAN